MSDEPMPEIQPNLEQMTALELWSLLKQPGVLHMQILRGLLPLTRMGALHLAGATDYDSMKAALEAAQAEAEKLRRFEAYLNNRLVQARQDSQISLERLGYKPGELITKWRRTDTFTKSNDPNYVQELYAVVIDALTQEGVTVWPGDGVGIVTQFIDTQVKAREKAQAARDKTHQFYMEFLRDWADADTYIRSAAKSVLSEHAVEGDKYGVPSVEDVVDRIVAEAERLRANAEWLEEALRINNQLATQAAHENAMLRADNARLREALTTALGYMSELHGEWHWKKDEPRSGNQQEYNELGEDIDRVKTALATNETPPA